MLLNTNFSSTSWICCVVGLPAAGLGGTNLGSSMPPLSIMAELGKGFDFPSLSGASKLLLKMKLELCELSEGFMDIVPSD